MADHKHGIKTVCCSYIAANKTTNAEEQRKKKKTKQYEKGE